MDITTPPLPPVAPEVLRVAEHRHKKGLMYPYIFHVLTKVCTGAEGAATASAVLLWEFLSELFLPYKVFETKFNFSVKNFEKKRWKLIHVNTIKGEPPKSLIFLFYLI